MRRYTLFKCMTDLDQDSVRFLLGSLPAWLKVRSDHGRAFHCGYSCNAGQVPAWCTTLCTPTCVRHLADAIQSGKGKTDTFVANLRGAIIVFMSSPKYPKLTSDLVGVAPQGPRSIRN
jgi:hypothetical protein